MGTFITPSGGNRVARSGKMRGVCLGRCRRGLGLKSNGTAVIGQLIFVLFIQAAEIEVFTAVFGAEELLVPECEGSDSVEVTGLLALFKEKLELEVANSISRTSLSTFLRKCRVTRNNEASL
jgi:hypothetical protein